VLSLVETPDLDLVPARHRGLRRSFFHAGIEPVIAHLSLWALSLAVRTGLVRTLSPLAGMLHALSRVASLLGTDRGGMTVEADGTDETGQPVRAIWTLIAERGDGPNIPALPALACLRGMMAGRLSEPGARCAAPALGLEAIEAEFQRFAIRTSRRTEKLAPRPLFDRISARFNLMPAEVQHVHAPGPAIELEGETDVDAAPTFLGRFIAWCTGFPTSSGHVPASVTIERDGNGETWIRRFGGTVFLSRISEGPVPGSVRERFGPISIEMDLSTDSSGFSLSIRGWTFFGVRLPRALAPATRARAFVDERGRYCFDTLITWPLLALLPVKDAARLVHYRGWLVPAPG
jgi:hypothetical protein